MNMSTTTIFSDNAGHIAISADTRYGIAIFSDMIPSPFPTMLKDIKKRTPPGGLILAGRAVASDRWPKAPNPGPNRCKNSLRATFYGVRTSH